jgi:type IV pilus assembly protein PilM
MSLNIFSKDKFVGIDIGHSTIDVAQVERQNSGFRVMGLGAIATPPNSVQDGVVTDPEAVGDAIRHALKEAHISASAANVAVAGATVVVRTVKMPNMPEDALRKSIRFEAGRYVPSSVEESYIECEVLGMLDDGQMEVLIVASPKDIVESRLAAVNAAGLDTENVDIEAFASYRAIVEADPVSDANDHAIAIIDIGAQNTDVSVVDMGAFSLTRSIPIGGDSITEALVNYFKLSREEAERGKMDLDLSQLIADGPMENPPLRVIQPLVDELVREIRRSLNYFHSQQTGHASPRAVTNIYLIGGGSLLKGLPEYLGHRLGIQVTSPDPFANSRIHSPEFGPSTDPRELTVALGLAMRRNGKAAA